MGKYLSLQSASIEGIPLLTKSNFAEWNGLLWHLLDQYEGASKLLLGETEVDSPEYCKQQNAELIFLIHRLVSSELRVRVRMATKEAEANASTLYHSLLNYFLRHESQEKKAMIPREVQILHQRKEESLIQYLDRAEELFFRAEEAGIFFNVAEQKAAFTCGLRDEKLYERAIQMGQINQEFSREDIAKMIDIHTFINV